MKYQICLIFFIFGNVFCQFDNQFIDQLKGLNKATNEILNKLNSIEEISDYLDFNSNQLKKLIGALIKEIPDLLNGKKEIKFQKPFSESFKKDLIAEHITLMKTGVVDMMKEIKNIISIELKYVESIDDLETLITNNLKKAGNKISLGIYGLTKSNPKYYLPQTISALKSLHMETVEFISQVIPVTFLYYWNN